MDRQVVRRDDVVSLREGTQVHLSSSSQEQVDHATASLADEMIVLAGLGIESGTLFVQEEGADLAFLDETVKIAINSGEADPRYLFVNPPVDLMGERVRVIALESFEHLLQLTSRTFAGGPPHRLTSNLGYRADRIEPSVDAGYQIDCSLSRGTSTRSSHASMVHARPGSGSAVGLIRRRQKHACRVQSRHDCNPTGRTVVGHAAQ